MTTATTTLIVIIMIHFLLRTTTNSQVSTTSAASTTAFVVSTTRSHYSAVISMNRVRNVVVAASPNRKQRNVGWTTTTTIPTTCSSSSSTSRQGAMDDNSMGDSNNNEGDDAKDDDNNNNYTHNNTNPSSSSSSTSEEKLFYDDFGGQVVGGTTTTDAAAASTNTTNNNNNELWSTTSSSSFSSSSPSMDQLQQRIRLLQQDEYIQQAQIQRNWKIGNWKVRGFALDSTFQKDPTAEEEDGTTTATTNSQTPSSQPVTGVTAGKQPPLLQKILVSRLYWDKSLHASQRPRILVGRTDGSLLVVQLGTEYFTKLSSSSTANDNDDGNSAGYSFPRQQNDQNDEWENDDDPYQGDDYDDEYDDDNNQEIVLGAANNNNNIPTPSVPFKICHYWQASQNEICAILSLDDENFIFTSGKDEGTIQQWHFIEDDNDHDESNSKDAKSSAVVLPYRTFHGAHDNSTILYLDAMFVPNLPGDDNNNDDESANVLISVNVNGVVALWDLRDGKLLRQFQAKLIEQNKEDDADDFMSSPRPTGSVDDALNKGSSNVLASSATLDGESGTLFVGLTSGHVLVYALPELLSKAASHDMAFVASSLTVQPNGKFLALEKGAVSSMACSGSGSLVRNQRRKSRKQSTSTGRNSISLLTGGTDGIVKQWEIIPVQSGRNGQSGESNSNNILTTRFEHWPRLANQRLSKRAHLFKGGHAETSSVRVIVAQPEDPTKFLSASDDGSIVAWSATKGQQLFRMEGFSDKISSLLLLDHLLITDGMDDYVCVHDFEVDGSEVEDGYEFEW